MIHPRIQRPSHWLVVSFCVLLGAVTLLNRAHASAPEAPPTESKKTPAESKKTPAESENTPTESETLQAWTAETVARNAKQMWEGFDPRAEPLEVETLLEWEEDDVVMRVLRFRIGVFKGRKAKLAVVYGFPRRIEGKEVGGETKIPGLLQIHGGGQYADHKACLTNAKRGYATVSIAWAGRISAPEYRVSPNEVKLFWDEQTEDPHYRVTTDWGLLDGYHAPGRNAGNHFPSIEPKEWTFDSFESPRNSGWFLAALAARRALTFLEQQPEVDANRLGVYGHSMGGKLTVMTSLDDRVKAAAPSCGGISDRDNTSMIFQKTIGDDANLPLVRCPIFFLSPANDFHGRIGDLPSSIEALGDTSWRVTCSPHHNHQDTAQYEVATQLWMDQHLKGNFQVPVTPTVELKLRTKDGIPSVQIQPDTSMQIEEVCVYYSTQGNNHETSRDRDSTINRYWHHSMAVPQVFNEVPQVNNAKSKVNNAVPQANKSEPQNEKWTAKLPLDRTDQTLWVYANVVYRLKDPIEGAGYYYRVYQADQFVVSSLLQSVDPNALQDAGVVSALKPTLQIESFRDGWEKNWFYYRDHPWEWMTHKLNSDLWKPPLQDGVVLAFEARSDAENLLVVRLDNYALETKLKGGDQWQSFEFTTGQFKDALEQPLESFDPVRMLKLSGLEYLQPPRGQINGRTSERKRVGAPWVGEPPQFRNLRWQVPANR